MDSIAFLSQNRMMAHKQIAFYHFKLPNLIFASFYTLKMIPIW